MKYFFSYFSDSTNVVFFSTLVQALLALILSEMSKPDIDHGQRNLIILFGMFSNRTEVAPVT